MIGSRDEYDILPEEPYILHETWLTEPIPEMPVDGYPSSPFKINDHIWRLIVYPKGYKTEGYLSVILFAYKITNSRDVSFKIKTIGGEKIAEDSTDFQFSTICNNRGFFEFIPLPELDQYTTEDNRLKFDLTIEFSPKNTSIMGKYFRGKTGFVGLKSIGKTYYLNAFIQIMFHLNSFCLEILKQKNQQNSPEFEAIQNIFILLQLSPLAPSTSEINQLLGFKTEEDWIQKDFQSLMFKFFNTCQKIIGDLFLIKTIECNKQQSKVENTAQNHQKILFTIQINNAQQNYGSLQNFFNCYTNPNKEIDSKSGEESITYKFSTLPPILIISINSFLDTQDHSKHKGRFSYPLELDMAPYVLNNTLSTKYELFGIVGHQGEKFDGKFYAICRTSESHKWRKFDNQFVQIITNEKNVLEDHYGSFQTNTSAILLSYIRQDKISEIMKKIEYTDLPDRAITYYKKWDIEHREKVPSVDLQLFTLKDYETKIKSNATLDKEATSEIKLENVPDGLQYKDILYEIQRVVGLKKVSLWELDNSLLPIKSLPLSTPVKSVRKVFVSPKKDGSVPMLIGFFDPDTIDQPNILSIVSFEAINDNSSPVIALQQLRATLGISLEEKLACFIYNNQRAKRISITQKISSDNHGIIIFQKENTEILNPQPRSIDLLPELKKQRSFPQYLDFINNSGKITAVSADEYEENTDSKENKIEFEISMRAHLRDLMRCIRILLNLSENDSILLFRKENNKPSHKPLNLAEKGIISQFLVGNFVFYKILRGISQDQIEEVSTFQCSIIDDRLNLIEKAFFIMPEKFKAIDVINKYRMKTSLSDPGNIPFRIVQLNGPKIICILNENSYIPSSENLNYRIEIIPLDQINVPTEKLLRVTFSKDNQIPSAGCFGFSFYLLVIEDEDFEYTLMRINKSTDLNLKLNFDDFQFLYTNDISSINFIKLSDSSKLSKILTGKSTMLYIVPNDLKAADKALLDLNNIQQRQVYY